MAVVSQLEICNRALARLPAAPIASIDEVSLEARECRRFYPAVIADMLDGPFDHDWSFATTRAVLAQKTNDRPTEWTYAYALPSNMASAIRVIPDLEAAGLGIPVAVPGDPYIESWAVGAYRIETPYEIAGDTLFSHFQNATLEYAISDIAGLAVSSKVILALELDLAARLAVPIKKNSDREQKLSAAAAVAWERAIADDRNRQPQTFGEYVSEALMARRGYLSETW